MEISLLMEFLFVFFAYQCSDVRVLKDCIDLGWQQPNLKASSLSVSNLTIVSYDYDIMKWLTIVPVAYKLKCRLSWGRKLINLPPSASSSHLT